jgi:CheY-like chemotaxis protein
MPSKRRARIFIIDDDPDDRGFIISALRDGGLADTFVEFENGAVLSTHLHENPENPPDVILLDLNMPVKNGFETLRDLKKDSRLKSIPVIILSASTRKEDEIICFQEGCAHFLTKPLDMQGYRNIARFVQDAFLL